MAGRQITIEFLGKDRGLSSATADADRKTSKLGTTLAKVGKMAAIGLAAGAVVAGKALFDMTKAAMEDQAAQEKLAQTLKNTTGATDKQIAGVEDWISKQGRLLGVTDDELRPAFQRLAEATGDVGKAQKLAKLAMDVSAGSGKSLQSVSEALMKAQNGQVSSLSRLGIETKNAKGETLTFEQATKKMADTFGGQAAAKANTLQGKMSRLKIMFDETKESIGAKLIPVVTKLADWFMAKALPAIQKFGREMGDKLGPIIAKVGEWFQEKLIPAVKELAADMLPLLKKHVETMKKAFNDAKPFLAMVGKLVTDVLIPGIGKLAKVVIPHMSKMLGNVGKVLGAVGKMMKWLWNNVSQPVFSNLVKAIGKVLTWFGKMLQLIGKAPGMGWVGNLGDKLVNAGGKAQGLSEKINKIPNSHTTKIDADTSMARAGIENLREYLAQFTQQRFTATVSLAQDRGRVGRNARGTSSWRGGLTWVGEEGPELIDAPRGTRIHSASQSAAMAGGDEVHVHFHGPVFRSEAQVAQEVQRLLLRRKRLTGGGSLGLA